MMSTLFCVILVGIARAVFRRYREGSAGGAAGGGGGGGGGGDPLEPPPPPLPPVAGSEKKHGLNRVKCKYQEWKYILKNSLP